jgi:hypothetical protein
MNKSIFHPQKDIEKIKLLRSRQFAIPELDWKKEIQLLIGKNTLSEMITNMKNNEFSFIIDYVNNELKHNITLASLEQLIEKEVKIYVKDKSDDKLPLIFHLIQLWGGNAGRMFYFNGANIDDTEYKSFIKVVLNSCKSDELVEATKTIITSKKSKHFNIAFATKHVSLWQRFGTNLENPLPIYDSIIAKNIMGVVVFNKKTEKWDGFTNNDWISLKLYWDNMLKVAEENKISTINIERQIFNYFREKDWERNYGVKN